jgi:hypothetical protein
MTSPKPHDSAAAPETACMDWMLTFTGRRFYPLRPRSEDVEIADIAHALAMNCRFNGHCRRFYSVAEHSVRVSRLLAGQGGELALWGLLHDGAEAYLSDLTRPAKKSLPAFIEAEDRLLAIVLERFGLSMPMPGPVRRADDVLLATELRDLMTPAEIPWDVPAEPLEAVIEPMGPEQAEEAFLSRYAELASKTAR